MARHPLLEAYQPSPDDPFDATKAAHLYNRAGFGGTPDEIEEAVKAGHAASLQKLMSFPDKTAQEQGQDLPDFSLLAKYPKDPRMLRTMMEGKSDEERQRNFMQFQAAQRQTQVRTLEWWVYRMGNGPYPMQEKLALFWHGHFTTSARDERSALLMWQQNELLRRMAAGNFGKFVGEISRNPAMLDYLNNNQNIKAHPNENYARELMELFTLGIGNYTEDDIKESARALTGWGHDADQFVYRRILHDFGQKKFLGRTGNFDGDDVIKIILEQKVCAKYIASKIYAYFVTEDIPDSLAEALGDELRESNYEIRPLLKTIFSSRGFYSSQVIGAQIKSPVQLVVGMARVVGPEVLRDRRVIGALTQMGQVPLNPPNVKGWPGGRTWINTSTLFVRNNTAIFLAGGEAPAMARGPGPGGGPPMMGPMFGANAPARIKLTTQGATAKEVVDEWVAKLIQRPIGEDRKKVLLEALDNRPGDESAVKKMVQLLVTMPEFQLC